MWIKIITCIPDDSGEKPAITDDLRQVCKRDESSSSISLYWGIGRSRGGVNPPVVVRDMLSVQTHHKALHL